MKEFFDLGEGRRTRPRDGAEGPLRIFLSSTSEDLKDNRLRVAEAIESFEQQPGWMETFVAESRWPLEASREKAAESDALAICVAHRYGWVPSIEEGADGWKSVTWHEVEAALVADKPVFAFLVDPEYRWGGAREQDRLAEARTEEEAHGRLLFARGCLMMRFRPSNKHACIGNACMMMAPSPLEKDAHVPA